jgi:hypothetical protein
MLKSKFFRSLDLGDEYGITFKRGLDKLQELPQEALLTMARESPTLKRLRTGAQKQDFIDSQLHRLGVTRADAGLAEEAFGAWLEFFASDRYKNDRPEDLLEDLLELRLISSSQAPKMEALIKILKDEVAPELHKLKLEREYAVGVLPGIERVETTVELRAILDPPFTHGKDAAKHKVNIIGTVPVVTVCLLTGDGPSERFAFQCDREVLDLIIEKLEVTRRELKSLALAVQVPASIQQQDAATPKKGV